MTHFPYHFFEKVSLSIVVPVFNEGKRIQENITLLLDEVGKYFNTFEVIVVSDGSTDETNARIQSLQNPHVKAIVLENNIGKGAAVRRGFTEAKGDFILFIDGGMELHPREIKIFLGLMYLYEADIVIGSKRHPQSTVYYPWYRRILSFLFQGVVRLLFKINVTDTQVGIKMFRKEVITSIMPHLQTNSYGFDLEVLGLAARFGYKKILEAPVRLDYFLTNQRSTIPDVFHTLYVGNALLRDTIKLWLHMRKLGKST